MYLSNRACQQAAPAERPYKLSDGDGMYLLVKPNGTKLWRLNYSYGEKSNTLALGVYPTISLQMARERRRKAREQLAAGINPALARREEKLLRRVAQKETFEAIGREWHEKHKQTWVPRTAKQVLSVLEGDLFPDLGPIPIRKVTPLLLLSALQKIEERDALDLLKDARSYAGRIFRFAVATGRADRDIAHDLRDAFKQRAPKHHRSLKEELLPGFLKALEASAPSMGRTALKLILLTLVRTTDLRAASWAEFDFKKEVWVIPADRMKMRRDTQRPDHVVPLSRQALELLETLRKETGSQAYLFPNQGWKHSIISENTMLKVVADLGYKKETTVHGLRSTGSTVLNESGKFRSEAIELQLAHVDGNNVRAAYNNAKYLAERKRLVQWWADFLDDQRLKLEVI